MAETTQRRRIALPPELMDYVVGASITEQTPSQISEIITALDGVGWTIERFANEETITVDSMFFYHNPNVRELLNTENDASTTRCHPSALIFNQPAGLDRRFICLDQVREQYLSILKLSNVVVEADALLELLEVHKLTLKMVELNSVAIIMDNAEDARQEARVAHWIKIFKYIRSRMHLRSLAVESLSWHDRIDNLATEQTLETPQKKYHLRCFDPAQNRYFKLSKTGLYASGHPAVKFGLRMFMEELLKNSRT